MAGYPAIDTWDTLTDEVTSKLLGFTIANEQICSLVVPISASATSITVDATDMVSRGIVEIDQELIYVSSVSGATLTIPTWGRGFKGTTPATHATGAAVVVAPSFPRSIVAREINNAIRDVWPTLAAVKTYDVDIAPVTWQYEMPADCERVIGVEWKYTDFDGWHPLLGWELTSSALSTDYATGKYLSISEPLIAGVSLHVTYGARPSMMSAGADVFTTTTGLSATVRDVVVLGAAVRLSPWLDAGRAVVTTVASDAMGQTKAIGNSIGIGRELRNQYQIRLEQERQAQRTLYPIRSHKVRW